MQVEAKAEINVSIDQLAQILIDPDLMYRWHPFFQELQPIKGTPGEVNSEYLMVFKNGWRKRKMVESVLEANLPNYMSGIQREYAPNPLDDHGFDIKWNTRLEPIHETKTRIISSFDFPDTDFLFSLFKKRNARIISVQLEKDLANFKNWAESNYGPIRMEY